MPYQIEDLDYPSGMRLSGHLRIPGTRRYSVTTLTKRLRREGRRVSDKLRGAIRGAFDVGGHQRHGGRNWRRLEESTIAAKGHDTILVRKRKMRRRVSVLGEFRIRGNMVVWEIDATNSAGYAHLHQYGFHHPKYGWVAPRPPSVITGRDARAINEVMGRIARGGNGR